MKFPSVAVVHTAFLKAVEDQGQAVITTIAAETDDIISAPWLVSFKNSYTKDPSYTRITALINWLSKRGYM